jgi:hypothetical protein
MKQTQRYVLAVGLCGIVFGVIGVANTIGYFVRIYEFSLPPDLGMAAALSTLVAVGLASGAAWSSLKNHEDRLSRIEEALGSLRENTSFPQ